MGFQEVARAPSEPTEKAGGQEGNCQELLEITNGHPRTLPTTMNCQQVLAIVHIPNGWHQLSVIIYHTASKITIVKIMMTHTMEILILAIMETMCADM